MINREQLKLAIDTIDETQLEILHRIIVALKESNLVSTSTLSYNACPLKGSVISEGDIISPIDTVWEAAQ
jgi:hypothetical protein